MTARIANSPSSSNSPGSERLTILSIFRQRNKRRASEVFLEEEHREAPEECEDQDNKGKDQDDDEEKYDDDGTDTDAEFEDKKKPAKKRNATVSAINRKLVGLIEAHKLKQKKQRIELKQDFVNRLSSPTEDQIEATEEHSLNSPNVQAETDLSQKNQENDASVINSPRTPIQVPAHANIPDQILSEMFTPPPVNSFINSPLYLSPRPPVYYHTHAPTQIPTQIPPQIPTQIPTQIGAQIDAQLPTQIGTQFHIEFPTQDPIQFPPLVPTEFSPHILTYAPTDIDENLANEIPGNTYFPTQIPTDIPNNFPNQQDVFGMQNDLFPLPYEENQQPDSFMPEGIFPLEIFPLEEMLFPQVPENLGLQNEYEPYQHLTDPGFHFSEQNPIPADGLTEFVKLPSPVFEVKDDPWRDISLNMLSYSEQAYLDMGASTACSQSEHGGLLLQEPVKPSIYSSQINYEEVPNQDQDSVLDPFNCGFGFLDCHQIHNPEASEAVNYLLPEIFEFNESDRTVVTEPESRYSESDKIGEQAPEVVRERFGQQEASYIDGNADSDTTTIYPSWYNPNDALLFSSPIGMPSPVNPFTSPEPSYQNVHVNRLECGCDIGTCDHLEYLKELVSGNHQLMDEFHEFLYDENDVAPIGSLDYELEGLGFDGDNLLNVDQEYAQEQQEFFQEQQEFFQEPEILDGEVCGCCVCCSDNSSPGSFY